MLSRMLMLIAELAADVIVALVLGYVCFRAAYWGAERAIVDKQGEMLEFFANSVGVTVIGRMGNLGEGFIDNADLCNDPECEGCQRERIRRMGQQDDL